MQEKVMTIEEIDAHIQKHESENVAVAEAVDICGIFKVVRPVLIFVKGLLVFKPAWQKILQTFIDALDGSCGVQ